ncbi:MAG: ComF family protein [Alphaproteobacteria bacterium]|nr:ComF family protein [Alphaproteobacteria bacterium]
MGNNLVNLALNLIFPPKCIFCGVRLSPKVNIPVCTDCSNNLPYCRVYKRCSKCGKPIAGGNAKTCNTCHLKKHYNTKITSAFVYTDKARNAVIALKNEQNQFYAKTLSYYVASMVKLDFKGVDFDAVVSVPPRKTFLKKEKFDQTEALAKEVSLRLGLPYIKRALYQTKVIQKQSNLSYTSRQKNVKGSFAVRKRNEVKNKTILLIDDVMTTGSTLEECAKMLKESGAFRIYSACIATTPLS